MTAKRYRYFLFFIVMMLQAINSQDCTVKMDLVFVVDSSGSVGEANFKRTIDFIQEIVQQLPVSEDEVRVALLKYSTRVKVVTKLNVDMRKEKKLWAIGNMTFSPGGTYTHLALSTVQDQILTESHGYRPEIPTLVMLITDGNPIDKVSTVDAAASLKRNGHLQLVVVVVGDVWLKNELTKLASSKEDVLDVKDFIQLNGLVQSISNVTCSEKFVDKKKEDTTTSTTASTTTTVTPKTTKTTTTTTPPATTPTNTITTTITTLPKNTTKTPTITTVTATNTPTLISHSTTTIDSLTSMTTLNPTTIPQSSSTSIPISRFPTTSPATWSNTTSSLTAVIQKDPNQEDTFPEFEEPAIINCTSLPPDDSYSPWYTERHIIYAMIAGASASLIATTLGCTAIVMAMRRGQQKMKENKSHA